MNSELLALTDSIRSEIIAPPLGNVELACSICCDWLDADPICSKCQSAIAELGHALTPVVPISLYVKPSSMRDRLTFYKDAEHADARKLGTEVAGLVERFFFEHSAELQQRLGPFDTAVVVPTKHREGDAHPLEEALDRLPAQAVPPREHVVRLGSTEIGRRTPSADGFVATPAARGRRYVLIDDVYTTGATAQSAAHALLDAGATVTAIVVVGRRLNPDRVEGVAELVARQQARKFSFEDSLWA